MPEKLCPDCGLNVHVRKRECSCGFIFPFKAKSKSKSKSKSRDAYKDPEVLFDGMKMVPKRSRMLSCGLCRKKMSGGMRGWLLSLDDGDKYWWCEKCYED
jgi:hypothetical protein